MEEVIEAAGPALCDEHGLDLLLKLLIGEAIRVVEPVECVVAPACRERVVVDVGTPES